MENKINVEELETYRNRNGFPILRKCQNCVYWVQNESNEVAKMGYGQCTFQAYYFAYTLTPNLYPLTKDFFLCVNHLFYNEDKLSQVSDKMLLKDALKKKSEIS